MLLVVGTEREKGIEPSYPGWKPGILPLNYSRVDGTPAKAAITMAVRANDIALRHLFEQLRDRNASGHPRHKAGLAAHVIELHRAYRERSAAL